MSMNFKFDEVKDLNIKPRNAICILRYGLPYSKKHPERFQADLRVIVDGRKTQPFYINTDSIVQMIKAAPELFASKGIALVVPEEEEAQGEPETNADEDELKNETIPEDLTGETDSEPEPDPAEESEEDKIDEALDTIGETVDELLEDVKDITTPEEEVNDDLPEEYVEQLQEQEESVTEEETSEEEDMLKEELEREDIPAEDVKETQELLEKADEILDDTPEEETPEVDYDSLTYNEMKALAKQRGLANPNIKKVELLKFLKGE